jgi:hypothetical protein
MTQTLSDSNDFLEAGGGRRVLAFLKIEKRRKLLLTKGLHIKSNKSKVHIE